MHLDHHPIPENNAIYVNDLTLAAETPYQFQAEYEMALTGKKKSEGGILPNDNVRIFVPMDLNGEDIMYQLCSLYDMLGTPSWQNENAYSLFVGRLINLLKIYDQYHSQRDSAAHSREGVELARKIVKYLEENDSGTADDFPFAQIDELREAFNL